MAEIQFQNVNKRFNPGLFKKKVQAVSDLSLEVKKGEVFGLIGPNGAGKSTTIRLMLGLIHPDSGTITFRGHSLGEIKLQREIGYLPENPYLYDHLTLRELLDFCGKASGMDSRKKAQRAEYLLGKLNMEHAQNRPLRTFSKGMLQRAGICFALLHDPALVILDEPMSGLDPLGRKMVFDLAMELKEQGKTVFFCSHILSDVERLCDRIGVLAGGRLARVFELGEFRENAQQPIHLVLSALSEDQRTQLLALGVDVLEGRRGPVLSITRQSLFEVMEHLQEMNIEVCSSRSERVSLEDLFLQTVEEQAK